MFGIYLMKVPCSSVVGEKETNTQKFPELIFKSKTTSILIWEVFLSK